MTGESPSSSRWRGRSVMRCAQRAFPYLGGRVAVDENTGTGLPYSPVTEVV